MREPQTSLITYVESFIIPLYVKFDRAHSTEHVRRVIKESLRLAGFYDVNPDMVYAIAAFHDVAMPKGRDIHHIESAKVLKADKFIQGMFSAEQITIMAEAIEDHRASSKTEPRSIYGRLVAEADRDITVEGVLERALSYGLDTCPYLSKEEQFQRMRNHLEEKYSEKGYMKLYIPESDNAKNLADLQAFIADKERLKAWFEEHYKA